MENVGYGSKAPSRRKKPHSKNGGHKGQGKRKQNTESLLEQPIADSTGAVPCPLCGHPVDPKRLHPHMVRFHGVAIRSKSA
jgi:hypothetical protein